MPETTYSVIQISVIVNSDNKKCGKEMFLLNPSFEVLKKKADEKGVSIYAVAKAVGFSSKSTLYDWCAGKYFPKADKLIKLAEYFGCDVMDFYK